MDTDCQKIEIGHEQKLWTTALIDKATLETSVPIEKLGAIIDLHNSEKTKTAELSFNRAFCIARSKIDPVLKENTVKFKDTNFKHETLSSIAKAVDSKLAENGLSYSFEVNQSDSVMGVTCILSHVEGHSRRVKLEVRQEAQGRGMNTFQSLGASIKYMSRYTLKAALGLPTDDDPEQPPAHDIDATELYNQLSQGISSTTSMDDLFKFWTTNEGLIALLKTKSLQKYKLLEVEKNTKKSGMTNADKGEE